MKAKLDNTTQEGKSNVKHKLKGGIVKAALLADVGIRFDPLVETVGKALGRNACVQPGCRKLAYKPERSKHGVRYCHKSNDYE